MKMEAASDGLLGRDKRAEETQANARELVPLKPGFHIVVSVVSVVSVVRKKFIGQLQFYGNLPYKCSIQKKRQIQLFVRDRMNSVCPLNFFRTTDTTDTTDTTIWKPRFTNKNFTAEPITKFMLKMNTKVSKRKTLIGSPIRASKLNKTMFICLQTRSFEFLNSKF